MEKFDLIWGQVPLKLQNNHFCGKQIRDKSKGSWPEIERKTYGKWWTQRSSNLQTYTLQPQTTGFLYLTHDHPVRTITGQKLCTISLLQLLVWNREQLSTKYIKLPLFPITLRKWLCFLHITVWHLRVYLPITGLGIGIEKKKAFMSGTQSKCICKITKL